MKSTKTSKKAAPKSADAIAILVADHKRVKALFKKFDKLKENKGTKRQKHAVVSEICMELRIHAQVEEEIFYPAVRKKIKDADLMDEADVEHAEAKGLILQLLNGKPGDDHYDAKVTVLGENINHHVGEEQGEMFKKVKRAKVDTAALGLLIAARKAELKADPRLLSLKGHAG